MALYNEAIRERDEARAIARRLANANTGEEFGRAREAFDALPWAKDTDRHSK